MFKELYNVLLNGVSKHYHLFWLKVSIKPNKEPLRIISDEFQRREHYHGNIEDRNLCNNSQRLKVINHLMHNVLKWSDKCPKMVKMLQDFWSVSDHFGALCIKELNIVAELTILDYCRNLDYASELMLQATQLTFICSNSRVETLQKGVKYVQVNKKITKATSWRLLLFSLLTLNIFHTFF